MPAHNPYTKEPLAPHADARRRPADYAFLVIGVVGVAYIFAYVWPWYPWTARITNSGQAVGFLYFFLGGYGFVRALRHRAVGDAGSNRWLAGLLALVAAWDVVSPFALRDLSVEAVASHVAGGVLALACAVAILLAARREPTREHGVHPVH